MTQLKHWGFAASILVISVAMFIVASVLLATEK